MSKIKGKKIVLLVLIQDTKIENSFLVTYIFREKNDHNETVQEGTWSNVMMNGSCCTSPAVSPLISSGYHNLNLLALVAVGRTLQPGVVRRVNTSPNEARKALLNPAWTAGQKITTSNIPAYHWVRHLSCSTCSTFGPIPGGLESLNKLPGKFIVGWSISESKNKT